MWLLRTEIFEKLKYLSQLEYIQNSMIFYNSSVIIPFPIYHTIMNYKQALQAMIYGNLYTTIIIVTHIFFLHSYSLSILFFHMAHVTYAFVTTFMFDTHSDKSMALNHY